METCETGRICRESKMNNYVLLTKLTSEGARSLWNQPRRVRDVNEEIEQLGCLVVSQFATLGPYDFVTVIEVEDWLRLEELSTATAVMVCRPAGLNL